jgi:propionyl-CoA carboxylase beta chain
VEIVYKRELDSKEGAKQREAKVEEFREKFANPYIACEKGYLDEIIEPKFSRPKIIAALQMLENKRDSNPPKKHGNIPL